MRTGYAVQAGRRPAWAGGEAGGYGGVGQGDAAAGYEGPGPEDAAAGREDAGQEDYADTGKLWEMSKRDLEKLARDVGVSSHGSKEELVKRIAAAEAGAARGGMGGDGMPSLEPAEPEA